MHRVLLAAIATAVVTLAVPAHSAEAYKCQHDGVTVFSDTPCGHSAETIQIQDPMTVKGLRADEQRALDQLDTRDAYREQQRDAVRKQERYFEHREEMRKNWECEQLTRDYYRGHGQRAEIVSRRRALGCP